MFVDADLSRADEPYSVGRIQLNVATFAHVADAPDRSAEFYRRTQCAIQKQEQNDRLSQISECASWHLGCVTSEARVGTWAVPALELRCVRAATWGGESCLRRKRFGAHVPTSAPGSRRRRRRVNSSAKRSITFAKGSTVPVPASRRSPSGSRRRVEPA